MTRQVGQRLDALRAIRKALALPVPPGRSRDELRTEAIAALLLPDMEIAKEWPEGYPIGSEALVLDANFERYARADKGGNVSIRRVADDLPLQTLPGAGPSFPKGGLQFSPDGRFVLQHCKMKETPGRMRGRLWRLDAPQPVELPLPRQDSIACGFEPDGHRCALAYPDQTIRLVDLATLELKGRTLHHRFPGEVYLAWCPRAPLLAVWAPNSEVCQLVDVDSGAVRGELRIPGTVDWVAWHPDGELLAAATNDRRIHLLDSRTGRDILPPLEGHLGGGLICGVSHAGDWLISDDWSGRLRVWDTRTGQQLLTQAGGTILPQFSRDDRLLGPLLVGTKLRLMRCVPGNVLRTIRTATGSGFDLRGTPCTDDSGRWLAIYSDRGVVLIDVARGREAAVLALPENYPFRFDPDEHALWTHGRDGVLRWPIRQSGSETGEIRVGPPECLGRAGIETRWGASRDGKILAIPAYAAGASLWHRPSNRLLRVGPQEDVRACAVSPDGRWAATGSHWLSEVAIEIEVGMPR
jgi:WD40 repeat protein